MRPCAPPPPTPTHTGCVQGITGEASSNTFTCLYMSVNIFICHHMSLQGITGEASSNTFTAANGVYLRGPSWDKNTSVTMPELMREASPFLRLITIFRNPVDRYFSAFYYYR